MLAGGTDEQTGEKIRQRGVVLPVSDQTSQKIGAEEEGAVVRSGPADHYVIATAGSGMPPVDHKLFGAQAALARQLIEFRRVFHELTPGAGRLEVHLDDARVGRDLEHRNTRIVRRRVAFDHNRQFKIRRGIFNRRHKVQVVGWILDRRHEDEEFPVARLNAYRRTRDPLRRLALLRLLGVGGRFRFVQERRRGKQVGPSRRLFGELVPILKRIGIVAPRDVLRLGPWKGL